MTGWQDSFQPMAASGGWQASFQPQAPSTSSDIVHTLPSAALKGAASVADIPYFGSMIPIKAREYLSDMYGTPMTMQEEHTLEAGNPIRPLSPVVMKGVENLTGYKEYEPKTEAGKTAGNIVQTGVGALAGGLGAGASIGTALGSEAGSAAAKDTPYEDMARFAGGAIGGGIGAGIAKYGVPEVKQLPPELQSLSDLPDAIKTGMFPGKPHPLETGLRANQGISEAFDEANKQATALYDKRDALAAGKTTNDNGIKTAVSSTVDALQSNPAIALDPKQSALLGKLMKIQDSLDNGIKSNLVTASGQPLTGKLPGQIPLSALTDLDESLSGFSKTNKFSDAAGHFAGELKGLVNQKIEDLRALGHGDFVDAHYAAKAFYKTEIATKFLNNKQLTPFWEPEDYYAWKGGNVTPGTLSRAGTFLGDLNSKEAGRAASIAQILPKDLSQEVFRKAVISAQEKRPTLTKAVGKLATGRIPSAMGMALEAVKPGNNSPLLDLAAQIKAMKK